MKNPSLAFSLPSLILPTQVYISLRMPISTKRTYASDIEHRSKRPNTHTSAIKKMSFPPKISLTQEETNVCNLLVDAATQINSNGSTSDTEEPLTLRITGGWVRDKLLGGQCNDIDIGINKMTGFEFATLLGAFLEENKERYNIPARSIHKIESNPDKSKHLETATTKILGLDIDFVNLRSETYTEDSRIPQMEFGTPVQDALRRDACINALFYNIHTHEVEDFTERGLNDMRNKLIRTPLAPFETFNDDPLRVLRLLRFSSRLGFAIVPESKDAMRNPEISRALRLKISRERVGTEIEKMLQGPNPHIALSLINEMNLFDSIFTPPIELLPTVPKQHMAIAKNIMLYMINSHQEDLKIFNTLLGTKQEKYLGWLLAALTPWKGHLFSGIDTKKNIPAAATSAREGLKVSTKILNTIVNSYRNYGIVQKFVEESLKTPNADDMSRGATGMFIRKLGADWKSQILCALLLEVIPFWKETDKEPGSEAAQIFKNYSRLLANIFELDLGAVYEFKPILNGKNLLRLLEQEIPGPWMTGAVNALIEWQLENSITEVAAAEKWVTENKQKLLKFRKI